mgnify:CR=1 FL=1
MKPYSFDEKSLKMLEKSCIPYAICQLVDNRVVTLVLSDGFCELFQIDLESAYDKMNNHIYDSDHPDDVGRLGEAALNFATEGGEYNILYRTRISGSYRIIHARGKHIYTSTGERLAVIWYSDAGPYTDEKQALYDQALHTLMTNAVVKYGNNYDPLTGLPNMSYFFKLAESTRNWFIENGDMPVLLYFDFNDMKNYNLKHGFSEGDKLLLDMSRVLAARYSNINCCRVSGDHFAVITKDDRLEETLREIFDECKELNEGKTLSVRVGIYKHSMGEVTVGIACDRAKMACDKKRDMVSSSFTYFNEDMLKEAQMRHYILENLDKAIREDWITVYYQPIIRSANGRVCEEEALVRWDDPLMGFLSPADFIHVLEDAKLLYKLDLCVLEHILKKMNILKAHGLHIVPCMFPAPILKCATSSRRSDAAWTTQGLAGKS